MIQLKIKLGHERNFHKDLREFVTSGYLKIITGKKTNNLLNSKAPLNIFIYITLYLGGPSPSGSQTNARQAL